MSRSWLAVRPSLQLFVEPLGACVAVKEFFLALRERG